MTTSRLCTFHVGTLLLGVEIERVQEVLRGGALTTVPLADPSVVGLLNLRGKIVTAVDARERLGLPPRESGTATNVVVHTHDEAVSLVVDSEAEVVDADDATFEPLPETVSAKVRSCVRGVYKLDDCLLLVLDTDRALSVVTT